MTIFPVPRCHQGRVSLLEQKEERRYIVHALYANTMLRGMKSDAFVPGAYPTAPVEVIEELNPIHDVKFSFRLPREIKRITLEPQGLEVPFQNCNGQISITIDKLICHQMIVLHY